MMRTRTLAMVLGFPGALGLLALSGSGAPRSMNESYKPAVRPDEQKIMKVIEGMDEQFRDRMLSVPPEDGRLLRLMAEAAGAKQAVEIGTSAGYSGLWIALALQNTGGKLTTFDIDEDKVRVARENFAKAGVDGLITVVQGDAHQEIKKLKGPVDFVFIDAEKEGYVDYLKQMLPLVRPGGIIMAHNTSNESRSLRAYKEAVFENPDLETMLINVSDRGMAVSVKKHRR